VTRRATWFALAAVVAALLAAGAPLAVGTDTVFGVSTALLLSRGLAALAVLLAAVAAYELVYSYVVSHAQSKRRQHKVTSILRLGFLVLTAVAVLGVATDRWVPALVSLGVAGVAVSLALQQPLLSLLGWAYIMIKEPYQVGDRVAIEGSKGDVIDVDYLVTTLWEVGGELVTTNQPSGRHITLPNSVVLSAHVTNFSRDDFPYVWNELSVQVAYETDLDFARERMRETAMDYLGDEMAAAVERYRAQLAETPVEMEVQDGPTVNVKVQESWVELRLRYLVRPRRGAHVRNELYDRVLEAFNEHPDRISFPIGRNR